MSEPDKAPQRQTGDTPRPPSGTAPAEDPRQVVTGPMPAPRPEEPTVGTGSTIAIGCVVAMVVVLGLAIVIMLWLR